MRPHGLTSKADLPRGSAAGRYLILDRIGTGSRGDVYAAYDPELERKVALKLLRSEGFPSETAQQIRSRILQEVQVLARLSHPQVVAVFETGTVGEWTSSHVPPS